MPFHKLNQNEITHVIVGEPQIGKKLLGFTCAADGKDYKTTNEATARRFIDEANGVPGKDEIYTVIVNAQNVVMKLVAESKEEQQVTKNVGNHSM
jgi:hypothetical protein